MVKDDVNIPTDVHEVIQGRLKRCFDIIDGFTAKLDAALGTVYHYTNRAGLWGILSSGKIWLTDIYGLNDPSEVTHGIKCALKILAIESKKESQAVKDFADNIIATFEREDIKNVAFFSVACFSKTYKDLGQWRAYGDDGNGFAIGFDGKLLENTFGITNGEKLTNRDTFPITYDDEKLCEIYKKIISEVLLQIRKMVKEKDLNNATSIELSKFLTFFIIRVSLFFKHIAYITEDEYRFLNTRSSDHPNDDLSHRAGLNSLIRYIDFAWKIEGQHVLQKIVIGPAANKNSAESFIQECLLSCNLDPNKIIISKSKIPYCNP